MKKLPLNLMVGVFIAVVQFYFTSCKPNSKNTENNPALLATFTVNELQADFKQFRQFLEDSHPRMYRFTSRWEFDSLFDAQYMSIENPMTAQKFYGILAPLTAAVGCGHTSLWTPKGFWDEAPQQMFPLGIHARDGQLYLVHSYYKEPPVKYGGRILSVNGQRAEDLVNRMTGNISSDGFIMTKKNRILNNEFPYLYALNFGFPEQFDLVVEEEGRKRKVTMEPVSRVAIRAYRDLLVNNGVIRKKDLVFEQLDERTAILTIQTFAYYDNVKGFKRFIDSSFQVIQDNNIRHLIIDMRGNDGGDPFCSTHLLTYLQKKPVIYFRKPYGRYARFKQALPMAENHFTGEQYYLIDGMCFSTTGHISSLLKYYRLGTCSGEGRKGRNEEHPVWCHCHVCLCR